MEGLLIIVLGVAIFFAVFLIIKALVVGFNIGRFERKNKLKKLQPATLLLQLNMFEPIITLSVLILSSIIETRFTSIPIFINPSFSGIPLSIIAALSLVGLLIILPLAWSFSSDHVARRVSHRLLWIGVWRVFWVFVAINTYGLGGVIGVVVLARSISSVRTLALASGISTGVNEWQQPIGADQPVSLYQPITMGPEGLLVGSGPYERRDYDAEHTLRKRD